MKSLARYGEIVDRPRSGCPRKLTPEFKERLIELKRAHPEKKAVFLARRYQERFGSRVSRWTVQRALREMGFTFRLRPRRRLTFSQMRERIAFAKAHLRDSWDERWFFDESYFNLYRHGNRYWVGTETDDAMELPKLTAAQEKISLGIAVAVRKGQKSALAFLPKNWKGADLVSAFRDTLYPSMRGASRSGAEMQLIIDNDGRHFEAPWKAYVAQRRISELRRWSSNSPDFNI